jgi:hypothetical protein
MPAWNGKASPKGAKIGYDTLRKLMDSLGVRLAAPRNERPP